MSRTWISLTSTRMARNPGIVRSEGMSDAVSEDERAKNEPCLLTYRSSSAEEASTLAMLVYCVELGMASGNHGEKDFNSI